jgi:hypothetical protein
MYPESRKVLFLVADDFAVLAKYLGLFSRPFIEAIDAVQHTDALLKNRLRSSLHFVRRTFRPTGLALIFRDWLASRASRHITLLFYASTFTCMAFLPSPFTLRSLSPMTKLTF